jgi:hypothetical protein
MLGAGFAEGEVAPPLFAPVHPCSMAATANNKESVIRRLRKGVLLRSAMLENLRRTKHICWDYLPADAPIKRYGKDRKCTASWVLFSMVQEKEYFWRF